MESTTSLSSEASQDDRLLDQYRPRGGGWPMQTIRRVPTEKGQPDEPHLHRKGGWIRSKWCFFIAPLILAALIIWATLYFTKPKIAPPDGRSPPWYPSPTGGTVENWKDSYAKASDMVGKMSLVEKVNLTTGTGWSTNLCVGNTGPARGVGFPMLCLQDGPLGIRFADNATLWPAGITTAATWNKHLIYRRGKALGDEHRLKGVNVLLGPSMGPMGRVPAGGRNWEGFGPDPVLAGISAAETIKGIQDAGVIATAKHYIGNEQEHFRQQGEWGTEFAISADIDDRTLHEIYLWPFQDSVLAGVGSIMCSYNMINSSYACQNSKLMNGILKDELGFQGFVQSDWLAQRSGVASALAGLDMSMPGDGPKWADANPFWGQNLTQAVLNESAPVQRLDDMVTRIVAAWFQMEQDNTTIWPEPKQGDARPNFSSFTDEKLGSLHPATDDKQKVVVNKFIDVQGIGKPGRDHSVLAQEIAAEGHVLVKNEGVLPINEHGLSGSQPAPGAIIKVGVFGEDAGPVNNPEWPNQCEDRGCNDGTLAVGWGSGASRFPFLVTPVHALETSFNRTTVGLRSSLTNNPKDVPDLKGMDLCFAFANADAGEGFHKWRGNSDRKNLNIQKGGDALIKAVAKTCRNTVVVIHAVGPVIVEEWADHPNVKAIILANLPGEKSGFALTDVLFGVADASGRLPYTVGKSIADFGPGVMVKPKPKQAPRQVFTEGPFIDYRHFDKAEITPRYPFGFGLSYTTWTLSNLKITELKPKSPLPSPRPDLIAPPTYTTTLPEPSTVFYPDNFRKLKKYIYPYLPSSYTIDRSPYPYPTGYNTPRSPSQAGGGQGGNPSLFEPHIEVSVTLKNTGTRTGKQVVQLYIVYPPDIIDDITGKEIDMPPRQLRAFEKVEVPDGKEEVVKMQVDRRALSYWSVGRQNWVMPTGQFGIQVGFSSRDLKVNGTW